MKERREGGEGGRGRRKKEYKMLHSFVKVLLNDAKQRKKWVNEKNNAS